jgi:tetratricopeptide (TPR) repeat protein
MKNSEDWDTAIDFISSGLKEVPLKFKLLYNYGCLSEKLGRFEEAIKFFEFSMEIKPRYTDSLFALAVIYFKLGEYKECEVNIRVAIQNYKEDSKYRLEVMLYIQAMCFRCQ